MTFNVGTLIALGSSALAVVTFLYKNYYMMLSMKEVMESTQEVLEEFKKEIQDSKINQVKFEQQFKSVFRELKELKEWKERMTGGK